MNNYWLIIVVFLLSYTFTGIMVRIALSENLIDVPNDRSSHTLPTPRGGGVAIIFVFFLALLFLEFLDDASLSFWWIFLGVGIWVALVGFLDDLGHIRIRWRLFVHFISASVMLVWLGGLPSIPLLGTYIDLGFIGNALAAIYIVWLLNLYNFMDGIDGIAGIEAVTVCLSAALLYFLSHSELSLWIMVMLLFSASIAGFLLWNFPNAKIFIGDVGSSFIGFSFGVMSIQAAWHAPELFWGWLILLGTFIVDATVTLVRRIYKRERFYEAHNIHAYQYAARKYNSHVIVSIFFAALNIFWLLPVAAAVVVGWIDGLIGLMVAYLPLLILAYIYKAGDRAAQSKLLN